MGTRAGRIYWGLRDAVRTQLWPIPVAAVLVAALLGLTVPALERASGGLSSLVPFGTFTGDPEAARTVLDAVASSLITVTSLTFSLTVVTLQLASSQFSPRLLRTFTQDLFVQVTLGLFLATFVFALTVLRSVQSEGESRVEFVPRLSITIAFLLSVASVVSLIAFLAHLTRQIRVETMVLMVRRDAVDTIHVVLDDLPEREVAEPLPRPPEGASVATLLAQETGFYVGLDATGLARAGAHHQVTLALDALPGAFLVEGTPVGRMWRADGTPVDDEARGELERCLRSCLDVGFERTSAQDVSYGLRQLTDVANKALSPGINDPTTAVHALGHVSAVLCALAARRLGPVSFGDDEGNLWLGVARPDLAHLLDVALAQPRHYGVGDVQVAARLVTVLADVAWCVRPGERASVRRELELLRGALDAAGHPAPERERLVALTSQVEERLATRPGS